MFTFFSSTVFGIYFTTQNIEISSDFVLVNLEAARDWVLLFKNLVTR